MSTALKKRLEGLERILGPDDERVKAIIISVVDSRTDGQARSDEADCVGLMASIRGQSVKLTRKAGEALAALDARAGAQGGGEAVACWVRVYLQDDGDRMTAYQAAQEVAA